MAKLDLAGLSDKAWAAVGISLPIYDISAMTAKTKEAPAWVHFGAGNIFRSFIVKLQDKLLMEGLAESGIIAAEAYDFEIIDKIYAPHDNLTLLVLMRPDGTLEKSVLGGVGASIKADSGLEKEWAELRAIYESPSLQMTSFTITEKGYSLRGISGALLPVAEKDMNNGPDAPVHIMAVITAMLLARFKAGAFPIAMVSMDNCSHNGEKLRSSVLDIAKAWQDKGFVSQTFVDYISDESRVSFPWTMIDKITPRPAPFVLEELEKDGVEGMETVVTSKYTYISAFVNAEVPEYLVIEDRFPNGRAPLEKTGVYMTDRETVNNTERMKVTTCLNPLHTAMSPLGCLLGMKTIAEEMRDPSIKTLVERLGYNEGMPVVINPGIIDPKEFIAEVINERLPNPFMPDTPQRIVVDTSQKVGIRFGETIKSYMASPELDASKLIYIPLAIAGWCRYLLALDDNGGAVKLEDDPMLGELVPLLNGVKLGDTESYKGNLRPVLSNSALFGVDLYEAGLGEKIEGMFVEMISGTGAVRSTLDKYTK